MADNQQMICPVCGAESLASQPYCTECGCEFKTLDNVSDAYRSEENERMKIAKSFIDNLRAENNDADATLDGILKNINTAENQMKEGNVLDAGKDSDIVKQQQELDSATKLSSELKEKLEQNKNKLKTVQDDYQKSLVDLSPYAGFVYIKNLRNNYVCVSPIFDGYNSYGSAPNKDNHHKIDINIQDVEIPDVLFKLTKDFALYDTSGGKLFRGSFDLSKGLYVSPGTPVFLRQNDENILEFRFVKLSK